MVFSATPPIMTIEGIRLVLRREELSLQTTMTPRDIELERVIRVGSVLLKLNSIKRSKDYWVMDDDN